MEIAAGREETPLKPRNLRIMRGEDQEVEAAPLKSREKNGKWCAEKANLVDLVGEIVH